MRQEIIGEIQRLAEANGGRPPGEIAFARDTGIRAHQWRGKFWARWGDALKDAGFEPNEWNNRLDSDAVLTGVIEACRHYGRLPTQSEFEIYRQSGADIPSTNAIRRHFGRRIDLIKALRKRAVEDESCADIAALLPNEIQTAKAKAPSSSVAEGYVYLIKSGDFYKIGRSDDLERRVKEIRVALPEKATLIHTIRTDDPAGIESYWHRRFADKRANGEWFSLTSLDVSAFRKRRYQ